MKKSPKYICRVARLVTVSAFAAALSLSPGRASAQSYTSNFNAIQSGQTLSGNQGWDTNDTNQSDYVGIIPGYSTAVDTGMTGFGGDHWSEVGGVFLGSGIAPSTTPVYLNHQFSTGTATSYSFNVDFGVSSSQTPYGNRDSFAWTFANQTTVAGVTTTNKIFSINFDPATSTSSDNVRYQVGANGTEMNPSGSGIALNNKYHLTVNVNVLAGTFTAALTSFIVGSTPVNLTPTPVNIVGANLVTEVAATWNVTNLVTPGSNALIFNNYAVLIPEPSTYAMLFVGAGLMFLVVRRRRAQA